MSDFVDECRREWKRLRVPETVADDMAAELAADLDDAEAEGASVEAVLGTSAADPRSFAAKWAAERGVIGRRSPSRRGFALVPAAIAVLALVAIAGAVLVIRDSSADSERPTLLVPSPSRTANAVTLNFRTAEATPQRQIWVTADGAPIRDAGRDAVTFGSILLVVALAGIELLTLSWWQLGERGTR
jgi:hypothetical protein